jgi:hypothetical protein
MKWKTYHFMNVLRIGLRMSKDIFEDLEKSIEDAFKPEEKKRIKEKSLNDIDGTHWYRCYNTIQNPDGTHSHDYSTHNHQFNDDYMRNHVYDELMFGPNRYEMKFDKIICAKCGSIISFKMLQKIDNLRYNPVLNRPAEYRVYNLFCPICANMFRTTGKVVEINVEVRQ